MKNEYELRSELLELKRFLNNISDISFSYQQLKNEARRSNVSIASEIAQLELLVEQAKALITTKGEPHGESTD